MPIQSKIAYFIHQIGFDVLLNRCVDTTIQILCNRITISCTVVCVLAADLPD